MIDHEERYTHDFETAARDIDPQYEPTELKNPVPWPFIAIAVALAIWGGATLYFDAKATDSGKDAQLARTEIEEGTAPADATLAEVKEAKGDAAAVEGAALFGTYCATCHQANGAGVRGAIPPLDGSRYVLAGAEVPAAIVLRGIAGPIEVKGAVYNGRMPTFYAQLEDAQIAAILTHVRSSWSNDAGEVTPDLVSRLREKFEGVLNAPWEGGFGLEDVFGIAAVSDEQADGATQDAGASEETE